MKRKSKLALVSFMILSLAIFAIPTLGAQAAIQADGTTGSIQASNQIFHVSGSVISVNMFDLEVSADYLLNWTGDSTGIFFNTSSVQTKFTHTFVLTSSSATVLFVLRASAAGTSIDSVQVTVVSLGSFLSTGLIISAGIFILIVAIFKTVASR